MNIKIEEKITSRATGKHCMSRDTNISRQSISIHIKALEKADYLNKHYSDNEKGVEIRTYELLT